RGEGDRVVLCVVCLYEDAPGRLAAPRAPGHLDEELERALRRAKIGDRERSVRADDADERDVRQIVPLRDHLRADEDVDLARTDAREDLLHVLAARDVAIEPRDPRLRERARERLLELLRAEALEGNRIRVAFVASRRHARL